MAFLPAERISARRAPPLPAGTLGIVATGGLFVACGTLGLSWRADTVGPLAVALALYGVAAGILIQRIGAFHPHAVFGLANVVTLVRLVAVCTLAGLLAAPQLVTEAEAGAEAAWGLFALALAILAMDGLDGWIARRRGLASRFGARFDMEVDALFAAVLAGLVLLHGTVGAWVIGLGALRYAFLAAQAASVRLRAPLPASHRRKAVCVVQLGVLSLLLTPPFDGGAAQALAALALAALCWSFAVDIRWLLRRPH
jgi:phosphatidylglycerophosphate synthase